MGVTGNFTSVTLGPDDNGIEKLNVSGDTEAPLRVKAAYVAVANADADQTLAGTADPKRPSTLPSTAVAAPTAHGWTVLFDQADPPYKVGGKVLVVGLTIDSEDDSTFFWQQLLTVAKDTKG
jgi:hypothetical protein